MPRLELTECLHLVEKNDWEGETWHFYVPLAGNEEAVDIVEDFVKRLAAECDHPSDLSYTCKREKLHLDTVAKLGGSSGYMDEHNVIEKLDLAKVRAVDWHALEPRSGDEPALKDHLYKGGLRNFEP